MSGHKRGTFGIPSYWWNHSLTIGLGLGLSLVWLSFYFDERDRESTGAPAGDPIGYVESSVDDVRRRPRHQILWSYLPGSRPVYEKDTIRTGPNSFARINLGTKGAVELQANSLAVLETENEKLQVHLASGSLFLKGDVNAKIEGRVIEATGDADVVLRRGTMAGQMQVESRRGQVRMRNEAGGNEIRIEQGERFEEDGTRPGRVRKLPLRALRPKENSELVTLERTLAVDVQFERVSADSANADLTANLIVELSEDPTFAVDSLRAPLRRTGRGWRARVEVPNAGLWHFRARLAAEPRAPAAELGEDAAVLSSSGTFVATFRDPPPEAPVKPIQMRASLAQNDWTKLSLEWQHPLPDATFELRVGETITAIATRSAETSAAAASAALELDPKAGVAVRAKSPQGLVSEWVPLRIDRQLLDFEAVLGRVPRLVSPSAERHLNPSAISTIDFRWSAIEHPTFKPEGYELQLEGAQPITLNLSGLAARIDPPKPGRYLWSVRARWQNGRVGAWSERRELFIDKPKLAAPRLRMPANDSNRKSEE